MTITSTPIRRWKAVVLSLLVPGLGHLYAGHARRGGAFFATILGSAWLLAALARTDTLTALAGVSLSWVELGAYLGSAIDIARLSGPARTIAAPRRSYRWYGYAGLIVGANLMVTPALDTTHTYKIPAGSMIPTLLTGDFVVANQASYASRSPRRGDVVIFHPPSSPDEIYVKRIVGLPGEAVALHDRRVLANGREVDDPWGFCPDGRGVGDPTADCGSRVALLDEMAPMTLGADEYFLLGDNRQHSQDSRIWGPVPRSNLVGKVLGIYWSWDGDHHRPRLDRIGLSLAPG